MSVPATTRACGPIAPAPARDLIRSETVPGRPPELVIATLNRARGSTGVHTHTRTLSEGVARAGFPVTVVSSFSGSRKWLPVFAIRRVLLDSLNTSWSTRWYRYWHFVALRENLQRHLAGRPVAAVVAQCPVSARAALDVRVRLGRDFKVALVCHSNGSEAQEYREKGELDDEASYRAIVALEDEVFQNVDEVIHVSRWSKQIMESGRSIRARSSTVIWNGAAGSVPEGSMSRSDLKLEPEDLVFISVGTLEPRKNQIGLLDLFAAICARYPRARLLLVGDGPHRIEIVRKVEREGLRGRVQVLGTRPDVPALLSLADIYIHYATLENCPNVMLEAARAGLPSAAVPVGGIVELQEQLGSCVALPSGDPEAALRVLEPLLNDRSLREEWGLRARRNFQRYFTREAMAEAYLKALGLTLEGTSTEQGGAP